MGIKNRYFQPVSHFISETIAAILGRLYFKWLWAYTSVYVETNSLHSVAMAICIIYNITSTMILSHDECDE